MFNQVRFSRLAAMFGVALLAATAVPQLGASEADRKTIVTFSAPVEISREALPAGTYVFKALSRNPNVVVVMNRAEDRVFATVHAIPIETLIAPDKARVDLSEQPGNAPEAIHALFYPGYNDGWEFPSPKKADTH